MSIQGTPTSGIRWIVDSTGAIVGYRNPVSDQDATYTANTSYTAAQLSALAAAGGLTPWATYVASDTGDVYDAPTVSTLAKRLSGAQAAAIAAAGALARPKICFFGDSTVQYNCAQLGQKVTVGAFSTTLSCNGMWAEFGTPTGAGGAGAGQLSYNATSKTMVWTASGDTAGAAVDVSRSGIYKLPSGTAGHALFIGWLPSLNSYTTGTIDVAVSAAGFRMWAYSSAGVGTAALAAAAQKFTLAPLPTSLGCPPGMDGFYGMGGATANDLLQAQWQWSQISSDIDVIQIGTNDFAGSVLPAAYLTAIQAFITARLAQGVSMVVWTTIVPRTSESTTKQKYKAQVATAMRAWAATMGGRVAVWDVASYLTDPATGGYLSGYDIGDGVHPSALGACTFGFPFGDYLAQIAPLGTSPVPASYQDVYDATNNPSGNLIGVTGPGVPLMVGTAGAISGTAAGTAPTGWTLTSASDLVATGSQQARTDGVAGNWLKVVLSGATSTKQGNLLLTAGLTTGAVVGGYYQLEVEIQISAASGLNYLEAKLVPSGVSGSDCSAQAFQGQGTQAYPTITTPRTLWLRTPPTWVAFTGMTSLKPQILFGTAAAGSATLLVGRMRLYKTA